MVFPERRHLVITSVLFFVSTSFQCNSSKLKNEINIPITLYFSWAHVTPSIYCTRQANELGLGYHDQPLKQHTTIQLLFLAPILVLFLDLKKLISTNLSFQELDSGGQGGLPAIVEAGSSIVMSGGTPNGAVNGLPNGLHEAAVNGIVSNVSSDLSNGSCSSSQNAEKVM